MEQVNDSDYDGDEQKTEEEQKREKQEEMIRKEERERQEVLPRRSCCLPLSVRSGRASEAADPSCLTI